MLVLMVATSLTTRWLVLKECVTELGATSTADVTWQAKEGGTSGGRGQHR